MAYYDAISNAIAARGNALAQSAAQQGQVYGNLAQGLGQLPFQAMQAGQRRRAIEVETQQRELQNQQIQGELDFQKKASAITTAPIPDAQKREQMLKLLAGYPEKLQRFKQLEMQETTGLLALNRSREGTPGTATPIEAGLPGELPLPTRGSTSLGNAFEPVVPLEAQRVHPTIMTPSGQPLNARTDVQVRRQEDEKAQAAAEIMQKRQQELQRSGIEGQKEVAEFTAGLKSDKPLTAADTDVRMEGGVPVTYQFNPATQRFDIRVGEARPQSAMGMGLGMPQFVGTQAGQAVVFQPTRGGAGKMATVPLPGEGSLRPRTVGTGEVKATSDIEASEQKIVNLKTMYNKDWVGPAQGRWNDWMMKVPGVSVDPKMAKFYAANTALENEVIKFITGAQMSEPESQRILRQVPTFRDKPEVWEAKYDQTLENVRIMKQKMAEAGFVFGDGGGAAPAAPSAPAASGSSRIVQRNKRTGAVRHSVDQGKTWQPGP